MRGGACMSHSLLTYKCGESPRNKVTNNMANRHNKSKEDNGNSWSLLMNGVGNHAPSGAWGSVGSFHGSDATTINSLNGGNTTVRIQGGDVVTRGRCGAVRARVHTPCSSPVAVMRHHSDALGTMMSTTRTTSGRKRGRPRDEASGDNDRHETYNTRWGHERRDRRGVKRRTGRRCNVQRNVSSSSSSLFMENSVDDGESDVSDTDNKLAATLKRVRIAIHPAHLRLGTYYAECADLRRCGVLEWVTPAGQLLRFRAIIRLPGVQPPCSPVTLSFTVPTTYPNAPPVVRLWNDTVSKGVGDVLSTGKLSLLSPSSWTPVLSVRDVVLAIIDVLYDRAGIPPTQRLAFRRGVGASVVPLDEPLSPPVPKTAGSGSDDDSVTAGVGAGAGTGAVAGVMDIASNAGTGHVAQVRQQVATPPGVTGQLGGGGGMATTLRHCVPLVHNTVSAPRVAPTTLQWPAGGPPSSSTACHLLPPSTASTAPALHPTHIPHPTPCGTRGRGLVAIQRAASAPLPASVPADSVGVTCDPAPWCDVPMAAVSTQSTTAHGVAPGTDWLSGVSPTA